MISKGLDLPRHPPAFVLRGPVGSLRLGISFRLLAGLTGLMLLTVIAGGLALLAFSNFKATLNEVTLKQLPSLVSSSELVRETQKLAANAPALMVAESQLVRRGLMVRIAGQQTAINKQLARLTEGGMSAEAASTISRIETDVVANLQELDSAVENRIDLERQHQNQRQQLRQLRQRASYLDATHSGAGPPTAPPPHLEAELSFSHWLRYADDLLSLLMGVFEAPNKGGVESIRLQVLDTLIHLTDAVQNLPTDQQAEGFAIIDASRTLALAPDGLIDTHTRQLDTIRTLQAVLDRNRLLAGRLSTAVDDAQKKVEKNVLEISVATNEVLQVSAQRLFIIVISCVIGAVIIVFYINKGVISRLLGLQATVRDHIAGLPTPIDTSGDDEISDIASALGYFVEAIAVREDALRHAKETAETARDQVSSLLNNSGQGFLSFGADLVVNPECSRACETMLGVMPSGLDAALSLYGENTQYADLLRSIVTKAQLEDKPWKRDMMLSLLPTEFRRGDRVLKAEYKILDNRDMMVILTDATDERALEKRVESEHQRLEMVVAAVTERKDFFDTIEDFRNFYEYDLPAILESSADPITITKELYREIHTFKGLLSQFSFQRTPAALHELEGRLDRLRQRGSSVTIGDIAETMRSLPYQTVLDSDLRVVADVLGESFLENSDRIALTTTQAELLEHIAGCLIRSEQVDTSSPTVRALLEEILCLRRVPIVKALAAFDRLIQQTAKRLDKDVGPVVIHGGDEVRIDPDIYRPFLRSLVHVFRNAVVHGIEDPDTRLSTGKDEAGTITCTVTCTVDASWKGLHLSIKDDGAGININALRQRAVVPSNANSDRNLEISDHEVLEMIFDDFVSTRQEASEFSGRGVGLASVRTAVENLGGHIEVRTAPGQGTEFLFSLPTQPPPTGGEEAHS